MGIDLFADSYKLLGAGGLVGLVGVGVILTSHRHNEYRERDAIDSNLFIERGLRPRLLETVGRYNQTVAARCRYNGPVWVPLSEEPLLR